MNGRERILAMIEGRPVDRLPFMPITMMFAADLGGRSYREYATDHAALVECQLRTAEAFDIDYVSCISDPMREASDCGAAVRFFDDQPPAADERQALLEDKTLLLRLRCPDPLAGPRMLDRVRAAELFRQRVAGSRLVEGWIEGPCAEAADLRGINNLMTDFYDDPDFVRELFAFVIEMELRFARAQLEAGVDLVGIGDAASSLVGPAVYEEFVWPFQKRMVDGLHAMGARVRLHICGNTRPILGGMGKLGCEIVDLDYPSSLAEGRAAMGPGQVLLGNLDPVRELKLATPEAVRASVAECRRQAGPRFIVGAGCEIPRATPHECVRAMADAARAPNHE
jgi:MtaA/CmuA family methyltransferase